MRVGAEESFIHERKFASNSFSASSNLPKLPLPPSKVRSTGIAWINSIMLELTALWAFSYFFKFSAPPLKASLIAAIPKIGIIKTTGKSLESRTKTQTVQASAETTLLPIIGVISAVKACKFFTSSNIIFFILPAPKFSASP